MSVRSLAATAACAVAAVGILISVPWRGQVRWPTPEEQFAAVVRFAGIAATTVACETGPPSKLGLRPVGDPRG